MSDISQQWSVMRMTLNVQDSAAGRTEASELLEKWDGSRPLSSWPSLAISFLPFLFSSCSFKKVGRLPSPILLTLPSPFLSSISLLLFPFGKVGRLPSRTIMWLPQLQRTVKYSKMLIKWPTVRNYRRRNGCATFINGTDVVQDRNTATTTQLSNYA